MLGLGAVGLAGALTAAALIAPERAAAAATRYVPADPSQIVARVPAREPGEAAARQALAASPENIELAVELAQADVARYRALSDPRYLGRAQATLARWWAVAEAPPAVLLLRATIRQSLHEFPAARADLDRLVAIAPTAQAHLTRAVVTTVTADYAAARASCTAVAGLASPLVVATCLAPLDGLAGRPAEARETLARTLVATRHADVAIRTWALTTIAELSLMEGAADRAAATLHQVLALDANDVYARNLLADLLLQGDRAADASALLAGRESVDSHLVRRAIAEHSAHGPDEASVVGQMRERIAAAAARGDCIHLREEAMFALLVDAAPARAVALAADNWAVQKELADARLLARAAVAARDVAPAQPVVAWARTTGVRDAELDRWLGQLEALR